MKRAFITSFLLTLLFGCGEWRTADEVNNNNSIEVHSQYSSAVKTIVLRIYSCPCHCQYSSYSSNKVKF